MEKIKVAIIGFGIVGKRRFECLCNVNYASVVALCDTRKEMFGTLRKDVHYYSSYTEVLAKEKVDAVFVCLSNDMLAEVSEAF